MFRIQSAHRQPARRPLQRSHEPAGGGRFRSSQGFSIRAYQHFNADRAGAFGWFPKTFRKLGRVAGGFMWSLLEAMHESRRKQAMAVLCGYCGPIDAEGQVRAPVSQNSARARELSSSIALSITLCGSFGFITDDGANQQMSSLSSLPCSFLYILYM